MAVIKDFAGVEYHRDDPAQKAAYDKANTQYATISYKNEHDMNPKYIFKPQDENGSDVAKVVAWATENKVAVAVRSGGHQYSGACSTGKENVQLDLSETFREMQILPGYDGMPEDRKIVRLGVSNRLKDILQWTCKNELFMPTGQCAYVGLGGHFQTGGYGQMIRSFGLLGDHVIGIRMVDHKAEIVDLTRKNDPDLFNAILGGSPGNFGIVTHVTLEVYKSKSYMGTSAGGQEGPGPYYLKAPYLYSEWSLRRLLRIVAKMADAGDAARGFDLCVNVVSAGFPMTAMIPEVRDDKKWQQFEAGIQGEAQKQGLVAEPQAETMAKGKTLRFAAIVVYATWCPVGPQQAYDQKVIKWFKKFDKIGFGLVPHFKGHTTMAEMPLKWVFGEEREFELACVKRGYTTNSRSLIKNHWPRTLARHVGYVCSPLSVRTPGPDDGLVKSPATEDSDDEDDEDDDDNDNDEPEEDDAALAGFGGLHSDCKVVMQVQLTGGSESQFYQNRGNGTMYSWRDSTVVEAHDCFYKPGKVAQAEKWQADNDKAMLGPKGVFSEEERRLLWASYGDWDLSKPEVAKTYYDNQGRYLQIGMQRGKADPNGTFTPNPFAVPALTFVEEGGEQVSEGETGEFGVTGMYPDGDLRNKYPNGHYVRDGPIIAKPWERRPVPRR